MEIYTYGCYDNADDINLWHRWYRDNPNYQGTHDSIFGILEQQPFWAPPHTKSLKNGNGLIEICLNGNVQWRIFGFWGTVRKQFIVVAIGYHKGRVYFPKDVIKTAKKRMKQIQADNRGAKNCERPT
jgi:Phage derived protein Gp49-like (DUF891)